jgi:uncharacterized membrane protein
MEAINAIVDTLFGTVKAAEASAVVLGIVLDFVFRLFKTKKPLSIAHLIGYMFNKVGALCVAIGNLFDKVLPQNVVDPQPLVMPPKDEK